MTNQKIILIGNDDMVLLFGLIGIEGIILENEDEFIPIFENLTNDLTIGMIIIAINITEEQISYLTNFKLNNRRPFIYFLPDILNIEDKEEIFLKNYENIIKQLTMQ